MTKETLRSPDIEPNDYSELTLRGLRIFVAVEETGSIGDAARHIGGSPSGVSQHITALEQSIGVKLFDRRARPISLTPAGQILRVHAHKILEAVSQAHAELAELSLSALPELTLAIIDDLDASLTPVLVSYLQSTFRDCFVKVMSGRSDLVTDKLVAREADITVSGILPADSNNFQYFPIVKEPFVLVVAKGAIKLSVAKDAKSVRDQISHLPFVQFSDSMPLGRKIAQHMKRIKFAVPHRYSFEASRSVFAMVVKSRGWTIATPLNLLDAEQFIPKVDILPLPFPAFSRTIYLIARNGELGHLPETLAMKCRTLLAEQIVPTLVELAPQIGQSLEIPEL